MKKISSQSFILLIALIFGFSQSVEAQSILSNLTFEAPTKLIRAKRQMVKVYSTPSSTARQAVDPQGYEEYIYPWQLFNVLEEKTGFYKIKKGQWVRRLDVNVSVSNSINPATMCNRYFGYCDGYDFAGEWIVTNPIAGTDFVLFFSQGDIPGMINMLRLGKRVGNVFVFKYAINLDLREVDEHNVFSLNPKFYPELGYINYELTLGQRFVKEMKHGRQSWKTIDLSMLNASVVEALFRRVIESGETDYFYVNADLLSAPYADYELG